MLNETTEKGNPMTWIADAHREWHTVHGQNAVCPLDCGVGEAAAEAAAAEQEFGSVRCGHCGGRHWDVAGVKACAGV